MCRKCVKCGGDVKMMVQMTIVAPGELFHNFTKANLRRKDVHSMGVNWGAADFLCQNPKCGYVDDGFGNYVKNLVKENEELKKKIKEIEGE